MAGNAVKIMQGVGIQWTPTGANAFNVKQLANNAGRIGTQVDLGAASRPAAYRWRAKAKSGSVGNNPTLAGVIEIYLSTSDGATQDGNLGTTDAALSSADKRANLQRLGVIVVDKADYAESFQASGDVVITSRYVSPVLYNATGQAFSNTDADHLFQLTPLLDEIQSYA